MGKKEDVDKDDYLRKEVSCSETNLTYKGQVKAIIVK